MAATNHWSYRFSDEEILGPLPEPPSFPEDLALIRDRVRKIIGKVSVPKAMTAQHPAVARLIAQDNVRRQRQAAATYAFSGEAPALVHLSNGGCGLYPRSNCYQWRA